MLSVLGLEGGKMKWRDWTMLWMTFLSICLYHALAQGFNTIETTFDKIEGQNMLTNDGRQLAIINTMHLVRRGDLHEAVFKTGGAVTFPANRNPCWANLDKCKNGFTLTLSTKLTILYNDDLVIASTGADKLDSQGMLLSYNRRKWGFTALVRTSNLKWIADVPFHWMPKKWHEIVFSWSPTEGIVVVIDGFTTGSQKTSSTIKRVTKSNPLCLGCSYRGRKFTSNFSVRKVTQTDTFYKNLITAGRLQPDRDLPEKTETMVDFHEIIGKKIIGTYVRMDYKGTVTLEKNDEGNVLVMETPGTYVNIRNIGHPCLDDIDTCDTGFTIRTIFALTSDTKDRQVILSSGVETKNVRGLSVHYQDEVISVYLKNSTKSWIQRIKYTFQTGVWYTLDVTWSSEWGIEVHVDNKFSAGTETVADNQARAPTAKTFLLGKAVDDAKTTNMRVFEIVLWKSIHERLTKTDMHLPRLQNIKITTTTTTSTTTTTTAKPKPTDCPELKSTLTLEARTDANGNTKFFCILSEVPPNNIEVQMVFKVQGEASQWFKIIGSPDKEASLAVEDMGLKLYDKKIYCNARARFFVRGAQWCSEKKVSNSFHVTLKMKDSPQQIVIWEGQPNYIVTLSSTVPPSAFCRPEDKGNCRVEIQTTFSTASNDLKCPYKEIIPQAVIGVGVVEQGPKACGVNLTKQNWRKEVQIPIKATLDSKIDGNQERTLRVTAKIWSTVTEDVTAIELLKTKVKIIDNNQNSVCSSYNDPHLKTFDAKAYDMHIPGEFVLYKHRQLEYEVRAFYQKCSGSGGATCNRAVAVRSGDDVISFTTKRKAGVSVQMYLNGELTPGTRIYRQGSGSTYEVHLPHGTVVSVKYSSGLWINIGIRPSSTDLKQTEGLCGTFNGRTDDDFEFLGSIKTFAKKWQRTETMFHGVSPKKQEKAPMYCSCQENQAPRCEQNLDGFYCLTSPASVIDITNVLKLEAQTPQVTKHQRVFRVKRAALGDKAIQNYPAAVESEKWTEKSAREYCIGYLESATQVGMCTDFLDTNETQLSVENCVSDIVDLGDKKWAVSHLIRLIDVCLTTITSDVKYWVTNNDGQVGPPSELVNGVCPLDCGKHGDCRYGVCNCNDGWTGEKCDIGVDTPPEVFPARAACDLLTSVSSCRVVGIQGDKFVPTKKLVCVFQFVEVKDSKVVTVGEPEIVEAMYVSQFMVSCKQPNSGNEAKSAFIAISNDGGKTKSADRHLHVVHKSSCQQCDMADDGQSVSCTKVAESCQIDGFCYAKFERFEKDACYRCDPRNRKDAWTRTSEPNCLKDEESEAINTLAIIFICISVILLLALLVMIVLTCRLKRKTSGKSSIKFDGADRVTF